MSRTSVRRARRLVAALVVGLGLLVSGCGNTAGSPSATTHHSSSPSPHPSAKAKPSHKAGHAGSLVAAKLPKCGRVWVTGHRLPSRYAGCNQAGTAVRPDNLGCSSGQTMVRFDQHFYGVKGGRISHARHLDHNREYLRRVHICRG